MFFCAIIIIIVTTTRMGKSSAMRRVIKTSTTHIYIVYARARAIKRYFKKKWKRSCCCSAAHLHSLSLKSSKELFSRAFDISLCDDDDDDDDEMRDYVETFERIFFLGLASFLVGVFCRKFSKIILIFWVISPGAPPAPVRLSGQKIFEEKFSQNAQIIKPKHRCRVHHREAFRRP